MKKVKTKILEFSKRNKPGKGFREIEWYSLF